MRKNIVITGAAAGIGLATARLFASRGWYVGISDVDNEALVRLAEELGPEKCFVQSIDVREKGQVKDFIDRFAENTNGQIDALFNNAGIAPYGCLDDNPVEVHEAVIDVNLKGIIYGIKAALPYLKETPNARIISMSSASAIYGVPTLPVYAATKAAVANLTEGINIELEPFGIWATDILVGFVNTPMVSSIKGQSKAVKILGASVQPEQVAETVWKSVHRRKVHWRMGFGANSLQFNRRFVPFLMRGILKFLTIKKPSKCA